MSFKKKIHLPLTAMVLVSWNMRLAAATWTVREYIPSLGNVYETLPSNVTIGCTQIQISLNALLSVLLYISHVLGFVLCPPPSPVELILRLVSGESSLCVYVFALLSVYQKPQANKRWEVLLLLGSWQGALRHTHGSRCVRACVCVCGRAGCKKDTSWCHFLFHYKLAFEQTYVDF